MRCTRKSPYFLILLLCLALVGCSHKLDTSVSLTQARAGFTTHLVRQVQAGQPVAEPPIDLFNIVHYTSPAGNLAAYLTPSPNDGQKRPAILWITGGDCNTIDDGAWQSADPDNDQSARAFREAGIVMMFPSLRGGNTNPGYKEGFFGEVDDVLAAADYLAKQDYVDPNRIYLGGHSTGGTLALLVAESSSRFRAVFAFGPVEDVAGYGRAYLPFDVSDSKELDLRAPGLWLHSIHNPVFVFEGAKQGNMDSLTTMSHTSTNPLIHFFPVRGATHFSILAPTTHLIADKILRDEGPTTNISFTQDELNKPFMP